MPRTDSGKLGAHMNNHDHSHDQCSNVCEVVGGLEDEGIRKLNCARIARRLDAGAAADVLVADQGA